MPAELAWLRTLGDHEWGLHSPNGEDGLLRAVFAHVGVLRRRARAADVAERMAMWTDPRHGP